MIFFSFSQSLDRFDLTLVITLQCNGLCHNGSRRVKACVYGASSLSFDSDGRDENVDLVQRKMTLLLLKLSHSKSFEVSFLETHLVQ